MAILASGIVAFITVTQTNPLSASFLEDVPPTIAWHEVPRGIGAESVTIGLDVSDNGAGLDEVIVRIVQNNLPKELVRKTYPKTAILYETLSFDIDPKELQLDEGNVELQVTAFDKALWNNGAKLSTIIEVNYLKPQITALTPQQNGVLGGTEMVFYKVAGKHPDVHGVLGQGSLYKGFTAAGWIDAFKSRPNVYISLYPIPPSFDDSADPMRLIARDNLGNSATGTFNYRIKRRRWSSFRTSFSPERANTLLDSLRNYAQHEQIQLKTTGDLVADLKNTIKALSVSDEAFVGAALERSSDTRTWKTAFLPPVGTTPSNMTGDQRTVFVGETPILRGPASGVRFSVTKRTPVSAANGGTVAFIGNLGLLGNTVIIDHGFGLASLYGHLSDIAVNRGSIVERGQEIGKTGTTGLAQSEEVYFEMRVHGVPVSPNEWWDQTWVTDHIDKKVAFVLRDAS